jgi:integrase
MRLAATYDLTWEMIDFGKGQCEITKKGGEKQTMFLSQDALMLLAEVSRHGPFVFNRRNRRKIFEKALRDARIENFHWHTRHGCGRRGRRWNRAAVARSQVDQDDAEVRARRG